MNTARIVLYAFFLITGLLSCNSSDESEKGIASYYADSLDGNPTASGEPYNRDSMTAAHRSLPFGTKVKVTNLENGMTVTVLINDRGPHTKDRIIDLSHAAAEKLNFIDSGTANVRIEAE